MRRIEYSVACSLDGYIAGPNGEYDWITMDPEIDFGEIMSRYDTVLMGRKTYLMAGGGGGDGMKALVFSRTLDPAEHPKVEIVGDHITERLAALRTEPGKNIWLFGGGDLFRSLLELNQVDAVSVAMVPVLLGGGIPLLPSPAARARLELTKHRVYQKSGIVSLEYTVKPAAKSRRASKAKKTASRSTAA